MKNTFKKNSLLFSVIILAACSNNNDNSVAEVKKDSVPNIEVKQVVNLPEITVIGEHHINENAITNHPTAKPEHKSEDIKEKNTYNTLKAEDIHSMFMKYCTVVDKQKYATHPDGKIISKYSMDETQTYIAFNQNKWIGSIAVVSDVKSGNVNQIIFTDSMHHQDVYNVKLGMTVEQVKELRKEMKFVQHEGSNYVYNEESNIMYLVDVKDKNGKEKDELKMEKAIVTAIIWKDKNHDEHPGKIKTPPKKNL